MKVLAGFVMGVVFAGLVLGIISGRISHAESDGGIDLTGLLPDIAKIYRESLASPFEQVRQEITDEGIADFYDRLMGDTGLDKVGQ
jgi:hypothetical protein